MSITTKKFGARVGLGLASSLVALTSALATHNTLAQENSDSDDDTDNAPQVQEPVIQEQVIVQGTRASLQNAQEIKRNADTFVDAISASDIGALPDRSVLEAMQRIPGISIERFAGKNDPDHFGVEGSGAVIRGMTQTRSEFNGRDSFTANSGRGLSFQDVPPELMGSVQVFKNQTADMIEGGIAGTVSLFTRLPFDQDGRKVAFSADVTYGDMTKKSTPTFSGLFSDRWDTNLGEIGLLLNASYSHLEAASHGIQTDRYEFRPLAAPTPTTADVVFEGFEYVSNPYTYDGSFLDAPAGTAIGDQGVLIPNGSNLSMKEDSRYRKGFAAALQWENPDETMQATMQFLRSDARLAWTENALKYQTGFNDANHLTLPALGDQYEFNNQGVFTSGTLSDVADGWRSSESDTSRIPNNFGLAETAVPNFGHRFQVDNRYKDQRTLVDDLAFNFKWMPNDSWEFELDLQHIEADTKDDDVTLMYMTHAVQDYRLPSDGGTPSLTVWNPWRLASQDAINAIETAQGVVYASSNHFNELTSYNYNAAMDHYERSNGNSDAVRLDASYFLDGGFFTKIQAGVRHAERHQLVKYSAYNWGALAPIWQDAGWLDELPGNAVSDDGAVARRSQVLDWSDFYRGGTVWIEGGNTMIHPSDQITQDYENWGDYFRPLYEEGCEDWRPADQRIDQDDVVDDVCQQTPLRDLNGRFRDREIVDSTEENTAGYIRADFEIDAGIRLAGNFGVRVVTMKNTSAGNTVFPRIRPNYYPPSGFNSETFDPYDTDLYPNPATDLPYDLFDDSSQFLGEVANFIPDDWYNFANNVAVEEYAEQQYTETLPSFNLKAELSDELIARFAVSKAIALPDIGNMRNYTNIGTIDNVQFSYLPPIWTEDNPHPDAEDGNFLPYDYDADPLPNGEFPLVEEQQIVNVNTPTLQGWSSTAGNPFLKPMESVQWDLSLEWYFDNASSITASLFYKDLSNFFINGAFDRDFTNPVSGVTQTVRLAGPRNGGEGEMKGFEINYQQFYDMLPEPFDGLGLQVNYSFIEARGVPSSNLQPDSPDGSTDVNSFAFTEDLPLEGQSDHTANFILMYQKNDWDGRIAYNWRSEYLLTTRDVITGLPVFNDDAGFLDASVFYNITDDVKIGFQGVNLANTETKTFMQVDDNLKLGRSWFVNDRRYTFVIRAQF